MSSKRAAIYARYSSHNQDDGTSIEVQLEQCRAHAGPDAIEYVDRAVSGTIMDRPALARLIADAEAGGIDAIYVHKYDRLGRSAYAHAVVADLEKMGVNVISATEGHDPLARGIQLVVAEDYSRKLSERTRAGRARRFEEGRWLGGVAPFGYRVVDQVLEIEPAEAEAVRRAYELYARGGYSYRDLSEWLYQQGFRPRRKSRWSMGMMGAFLRLRLYQGYRRLNGRERYHAELRIVSDELAEQVRRRNEHRREMRRKPAATAVFTRLIYCGCCGERYMRRVDRYKGKLYPAKWVCARRQSVGARHCPDSACILEDDLLRDLTDCAMSVIDDREALVRDAIAEAQRMMGEGADHAPRLRAEVARLDEQIGHLVGLASSGQMSDADAAAVLGERLGQLKRERDERAAALANLDAASATIDAQAIRREIEQALSELSVGLDAEASAAEINAWLRDQIGPIQVAPNGTVGPAGESACPPGRTSDWRAGLIRSAFWAAWAA